MPRKKGHFEKAGTKQGGQKKTGAEEGRTREHLVDEAGPEDVSILSQRAAELSVNAPIRAHVLLRLQRQQGNAHLREIVQSRLAVGQPDDLYEREADHVAEEVVGMSEAQVQRQMIEEEEELQAKPTADRIAGLADHITPLAQRQEEEEEEELYQLKPIAGQRGTVILRQEELEEEELVQPTRGPAARIRDSEDLEDRVNSVRQGGQPLPDSQREYFESRFGYDFGDVRIHSGGDAASAAHDINARSFTIGHDIAFATGEYDFSSSQGRKLLAHELTHVVQQEGGRGATNRGRSATSARSWGDEAERYPDSEESRERHTIESGPDISGATTDSVQKVPVDAAVLITELDRYGRREVLQGLVDAEKDAIDRFHDQLKNQADQATDFWSMIGGGAGTVVGAAAPGAVGVGATAAAPYVLVGGLLAAAGVLLVGQWPKSGIERFLRQSKTRCREEADEHGRQYEPTVTALANSFGQRVAAGQEPSLTADTEQYVQIREVFRTRILQAPSTDRVYDLKWNRLADSWNHYLRGSVHWHTYPETAGQLLMSRRPVRD